MRRPFTPGSSVAWLAARVMQAACRTMPRSQRSWAEAMRAEFEALSGTAGALRWALGALSVGLLERIRSMTPHHSSALSPSPWILGAEMLVAFGPLTWLFGAVVVLAVHGTMPWPLAALWVSSALLGPMGLLLAAFTIARPGATPARAARLTLLALAAWTVLAYGAHVGIPPVIEFWREMVLIAVLPALASAHLWLLGSRTAAALNPGMRG